jgi:hypothetical protein
MIRISRYNALLRIYKETPCRDFLYERHRQGVYESESLAKNEIV